MFRGGCCLFKAKHPKKGKPELYRISKIYWSSAQLVSYQHQDLLEQRASESKTYWNSAQVSANLLEQRAGHSRKLLIFWFFPIFFRPHPFNLLFNLKRQS